MAPPPEGEGRSSPGDEPKLRQYNPRWGAMETNEAYLVLPTRTYSRPLYPAPLYRGAPARDRAL